MRADPPIPKSGNCAQCGQPRPVAKPQRGVPAHLYRDPFCSSKCARAWHNTSLPPTKYVDPDEAAA